MTTELTAVPLSIDERWQQHFAIIEQLPHIPPAAMRVLEREDEYNLVAEGKDALLDDWSFWSSFCELLQQGASRVAAARALGVWPQAVQSLFREVALPLPELPYERIAATERRNRILEVMQRVGEAEGQLELKYTSVVHEAATIRGDVKAAQYLLERRFRQQWAPDKSVVHKGGKENNKGKTPGAVVIQNSQITISKMTDEQLAMMDTRGEDRAARKVAIPGKVVVDVEGT